MAAAQTGGARRRSRTAATLVMGCFAGKQLDLAIVYIFSPN